MEELKSSLRQYNEQISMIREGLASAEDDGQRETLLALQSELEVLVQLTQESINALSSEGTSSQSAAQSVNNELDDEYALFMKEMASSGAYESENVQSNEENSKDQQEDASSDIEDDLSTLLGMKCGVYHTHKWGGQPSLHNAMVSAIVPRQDNDQFSDLQVQILYTHPTHAEMLPCPFYLDGECRFNDEQCRYSHGATVPLSELKEATEPNFESIKLGSRILIKLKPPDNQDDISLKRKSSEKYHLWHRAIVKSVDFEKKMCITTLEHGMKTGEKRKSEPEEHYVRFEEIFPLHNENDSESVSDDSLSDTEYPDSKAPRVEADDTHALLVERSLEYDGPAMGEWERHTRGIGSKLMLAMGYVPGTGLGAAGAGRTRPVEARALPRGRGLDHCLAPAEDPREVEKKLKRLQKKEEERNKRAYEREKERERRNVFNFLNKTLGDKSEDTGSTTPDVPVSDVKQSTNKNLNIEQFKIAEQTKKIERDLTKLSSSLARYTTGSEGHRNLNIQIIEKNKELNELRKKGQQISKEQSNRKNKQKMLHF